MYYYLVLDNNTQNTLVLFNIDKNHLISDTLVLLGIT